MGRCQLDIDVPVQGVRRLDQQGIGLAGVSRRLQDVDLGEETGPRVAAGVETGVHGRETEPGVSPQHPDIVGVFGGQAGVGKGAPASLDIGGFRPGVITAGHQDPGADPPGLRSVQPQGHAPVYGGARIVMAAEVVEGGGQVVPGHGAVRIEVDRPAAQLQGLQGPVQQLQRPGPGGQGEVVRPGLTHQDLGQADGAGGVSGLQKGYRLP